jgi:hypothetical protein
VSESVDESHEHKLAAPLEQQPVPVYTLAQARAREVGAIHIFPTVLATEHTSPTSGAAPSIFAKYRRSSQHRIRFRTDRLPPHPDGDDRSLAGLRLDFEIVHHAFDAWQPETESATRAVVVFEGFSQIRDSGTIVTDNNFDP